MAAAILPEIRETRFLGGNGFLALTGGVSSENWRAVATNSGLTFCINRKRPPVLCAQWLLQLLRHQQSLDLARCAMTAEGGAFLLHKLEQDACCNHRMLFHVALAHLVEGVHHRMTKAPTRHAIIFFSKHGDRRHACHKERKVVRECFAADRRAFQRIWLTRT